MFGVARGRGCVSAYGDHVVELAALAAEGVLDVPDEVFARPSLNAFLALGRSGVAAVSQRLAELIDAHDPRLRAASVAHSLVALQVPVVVGDFVDFSASEHHAKNMGRLLRPGGPPLPPDWHRRPVAYHGRAGSIVVSGTDVIRPRGPLPEGVGPTAALDFEAEVGFVVGPGSQLGEPVTVDQFEDHAVGILLVNDWSARDIQRYESVPLGPFLGKSFATSVSPWILPLDAIDPSAIQLEVTLQSATMRREGVAPALLSRLSFKDMYWTLPQLLAHATVNGAPVRPGDLFASGTVSGPEPGTQGCLMELAWGGERPIELPDGTRRSFLEDGDTVTVGGWAGAVSLGEVTGTVCPPRALEV